MPDQLFHKRKKREAELKRKKASRKPALRYLVVTEGEKTEPNYLMALRDSMRINRENLIIHPGGIDPSQIVQLAISKYNKDHGYNIIFCVFDQDSHSQYVAALKRVKDLHGKYPIEAITSTPCFELWFLLHYSYSTKPYHAKGKLSLCDCVICDLKKFIPTYKKDSIDYKNLLPLTSIAIENASKLKSHNQLQNTDNPSTDVHLMVQLFQKNLIEPVA